MDEYLVKHAYEQTITFASRLSLYSRADLPISGEVENRQDLLVLDDLIHFAYHTRRLFTLTGTEKLFSSRSVTIQRDKKNSLEFKKILHTIVHNEYIEVVRSDFKEELIKTRGSDINVDLIIKYSKNKPRLVPVKIILKSDQESIFTFSLKDFIDVFEKNILETVIDICSEKRIYLGSFFD